VSSDAVGSPLRLELLGGRQVRHTFAVTAIQKGISLPVLQRL
jgi:hypothetical protein